MSCNTCYPTGSTSGACGTDPCFTEKIGSNFIVYQGPSLPCTGINTCDNLTLALQKIDNFICNPPGLEIYAENGLTKVGNTIILGGPLIQQTVITTSFAYTLALVGLVDDTSPDYFVTQRTDGVLTRTSLSAMTTAILAQITVNNGLTKTGNLIQLGGVLILPDTNIITNSSTNTLSVTGLDQDKNPDFILTETTAGIVRKISLADLNSVLGTPITANNGLTKTANNIQLGGALIKNTTIDTDVYSLVVSSDDGAKYSTATFNVSANILQNGDDIAVSPSGSYTRTITFKSSASTWLTNFTSTAYNAQANWEAAHPWVVMDSAHNFQVVDYVHAVNRSSAFLAHYYDERVNNSNWQDTWYSLAGYTADTGLPALSAGDYFTIADYDPADDFSMAAASVYSGTMNTTGCVFISNGVAPTWTLSRIDGDFPVIDFEATSAFVITRNISGIGRVNTRAKVFLGEHDYVSIGSNAVPSQKWGTAIGLNNNVLGGGYYGFAAGVANTLSAGSSSYAIGETNTVASGGSGALGVSVNNQGYHSHGIGYDIEIASGNTGSFHVGQFNNILAVDYSDELGTTTYPAFSVGNGTQSGSNPAEPLNAFHVMKSGFVKSKEGYDARSGQRGVLPPQWSEFGWIDVGGQTFDAGAKYIINQYESGDVFSNLVDKALWGQVDTKGFVFIANSNINPTNWLNGSEIIKVGRPTSPELGEMGFNLNFNKMEYWNGANWIQF